MLRVDKLIRFYKIKNILREKISLSLNELKVMYPFLSRGEAELLYIKLQKIKNPTFEFKHSNTHKNVRRYKRKTMVPTEKKEVKVMPKKNEKAPNRYNDDVKKRAVQLYHSGKNVHEIVKILNGPAHKAVRRYLKKAGITNINNKH